MEENLSSIQDRKRFIKFLLNFIFIFVFGLVAIQQIARYAYFDPLCKTYGEKNGLTFITYNNGGRTSPPACEFTGQSVPIKTITGETTAIAPILVDAFSILLPALVAIFTIRAQKPPNGHRIA